MTTKFSLKFFMKSRKKNIFINNRFKNFYYIIFLESPTEKILFFFLYKLDNFLCVYVCHKKSCEKNFRLNFYLSSPRYKIFFFQNYTGANFTQIHIHYGCYS